MNYTTIFPVHPKTKKILDKIKYNKNLIKCTEPMNYFSFLNLLKYAKLALSDSGGVQEEACILKTPLVTIRNSTERPETLEIGCNILSKVKNKNLYEDAMKIIKSKISWRNPYGSGKASQKSYYIINKFLNKNASKFY